MLSLASQIKQILFFIHIAKFIFLRFLIKFLKPNNLLEYQILYILRFQIGDRQIEKHHDGGWHING